MDAAFCRMAWCSALSGGLAIAAPHTVTRATTEAVVAFNACMVAQ